MLKIWKEAFFSLTVFFVKEIIEWNYWIYSGIAGVVERGWSFHHGVIFEIIQKLQAVMFSDVQNFVRGTADWKYFIHTGNTEV